MTQAQAEALRDRLTCIEQTYEFMLAYAAQGLTGDEAGGAGAQLRDFLRRCNEALEGLPQLLKTLVTTPQLEPAAAYDAFIDIVKRDTQYTQTAIQLVLAQRAISSQLIDNLNAWMHLRTLLTDLFVIDEIYAAPNADWPPSSLFHYALGTQPRPLLVIQAEQRF